MWSIKSETLKSIADAIRSKLSTDKTYSSSDIPQCINEVYEAGKQGEYDRFWDIFQQNGERNYYNYAFSYGGWTDETYNPKYPIICGNTTAGGNNIFRSSPITDTKVPITIVSNAAGAFYSCPNIKTIRKLIVTEETSFSNTFYTTYTIENITIEGTIGKDFSLSGNQNLTKESITSIINALSLNTIDKTVTLSKTAVNNAFETVEGLKDGSTSEEWLALINTKPNWTIAI